MSKADDMRMKWLDAKERIAKIGRVEPHFTPAGRGYLSGLTVKTTIHHQAAPSATNYWDDAAFDFALAEVIKERFLALADAALARMEQQADAELVSEESALRKRLLEIERIKAPA